MPKHEAAPKSADPALATPSAEPANLAAAEGATPVGTVAYAPELPRGGGRQQLGQPYEIGGTWYRPQHDPDYNEVGLASWYGSEFHGRLTANGEVFDKDGLTGAHPTLPLPSYVRVTNTANGNSVMVRVNDRGPFSDNRLIDVSSRAADLLDFKRSGVATVRVEFVEPARLEGDDTAFLMASYRGPELPLALPTAVAAAEAAKPVKAAEAPIVLASGPPFDPSRTLAKERRPALSTNRFTLRSVFQPRADEATPAFSLRSSYLPANSYPGAFQAIADLDRSAVR